MPSSELIITALSEDEFLALTRPLIGLPVSHPWRGSGTALFMELGALTKPGPQGRNPKGEAGVMIEWSWRIESVRSVQQGSWSSERKIDNGVRELQDHIVQEVSLVGRLPELSIRLSANKWVQTFMTAEGQPAWTIFLQDGTWITVRRGRLVREIEAPLVGKGGSQ